MNRHKKYSPAGFIRELLSMDAQNTIDTSAGTIRKVSANVFKVTPSRASVRSIDRADLNEFFG